MTTAELLNQTRDDQQPVVHHPETDHRTPLFADGEVSEFRSRWQNVQGDFVDDPKRAVQQADELVASTIKRLTEIFAQERNTLEQDWSRGEEADTEQLRQALRRYRSFFDRLLSA